MSPRLGGALCGALLLLFAGLSYGAVLTKSPTFDEPVQAVGGWLRLHYGDFRFNFEDPPLWEMWAALPNGRDALKPAFDSPAWVHMPDNLSLQYAFTANALYQSPGVDADAFINRSRAMMLCIGVVLGLLIAGWAWQLRGPTAAVVATALFALDPNLLAHAPLVKNDVPMTAVVLAAAMLVWRMGRRLTVANAIGLAVLCGVAATIKFSCVILLPIVLGLLALRIAARQEWPTFLGVLAAKTRRAGAVVGLAGACFATAIALTWVVYDFRFSVAPDPSVHINAEWVLHTLKNGQVRAEHAATGDPPPEAFTNWKPDGVTSLVKWLEQHRLLPEAWCEGFIYTYGTAVWRSSYLAGMRSQVGWWYYFPVAVLLKTPLATLLSLAAAAAVAIVLLRRTTLTFETRWKLACLGWPPAVYFASVMRSHMNIGIRHVLPIYPFAYAACGVVVAAAVKRWGRRVLYRVAVLGLALAVETGLAAPDFISFFNVFGGGPLTRVSLLGDSNLDWGQDLKLVAAWQREHPSARLYLSYFGMADPAAYGIKYRPLAGNYAFGLQPDNTPIEFPAVFAISASHLQGYSIGSYVGDSYAQFARTKPTAVLGGSIFLYEMPDAHALDRELSGHGG
jgi:hypothetical protein